MGAFHLGKWTSMPRIHSKKPDMLKHAGHIPELWSQRQVDPQSSLASQPILTSLQWAKVLIEESCLRKDKQQNEKQGGML